ncbi:MAG: transglycosylase SLT domain-containing protein [Magnetococcales bacterium]|nr:transglycosylase SLT domain-containing protein [Magnetococcales bacterium]
MTLSQLTQKPLFWGLLGGILATLCAVVLTTMTGPGAVWAGSRSDNGVAGYAKLFRIMEGGGSLNRVLDRNKWPDNTHLASYLEMELFYHPNYKATSERMLRFLKRWPNHPQAYRVRSFLDKRILKNNNPNRILGWFDKRKPRFAAAWYQYMDLLIKEGRAKEAEKHWKSLYRKGYVLPNYLSKHLENAYKRFSKDDHQVRARALVGAKKKKTLKQHLGNLSRDQQNYFLALSAAKEAMKKFNTYVGKLPKSLSKKSELWSARIEGLRRHGYYKKAIQMLEGREGRNLTAKDRHRLRFRLARSIIAKDRDFKQAYRLLKPNVKEMGGKLQDSLWMAAWSAWKLNRKKDAYALFSKLAREGMSDRRRAQGAFWAGRAALDTGKDPQSWLKIASGFPETFYGLLALETRQKRLDALPSETRRMCKSIPPNPKLAPYRKRMAQLAEVGRGFYNDKEVQRTAELTGVGKLDQLCLAKQYGAPNLVIKLATALHRDGLLFWDGLYPNPDWKPATGWTLDPAVVWGLGRQESLLFHRVESPVGARGILQLMPKTARVEAKLLSMPEATRYRLQFPSYNLSLGQSYIKRMTEQWDGDIILGLVSYNAGPHRAKKWRQDRQEMDPLTFIESIPFTETRNYVKKVLHGITIYRLRMTGRASLKEMLPRNAPGMSRILYKPL